MLASKKYMSRIYDEFVGLIHEFESLPEDHKSESIFDIAGYPHYENVASNILSFYLNPNNEHGLGYLLLSSLLELAEKSDAHQEYVQVSREVSTNREGRLDIVIETNNKIIGVENKIFHSLDNDLEDYSDTIDGWANPNQLDVVKIILSIKNEGNQHDFVNITYKEYWAEIRKRMGSYVNTSSQKWILYLVDFMSTIEKLSGENMEIDENDKFFIENEERVSNLINARNKFVSKLQSKVRDLQSLIPKPNECKKQWIYAKSCLVHDYNLSGHSISFDLYLSPKGWVFQLFGRNTKSQSYLQNLFVTPPLSEQSFLLKDSRYVIGEYDLTTDLTYIKEKVFKWFDVLIQAEESINANE